MAGNKTPLLSCPPFNFWPNGKEPNQHDHFPFSFSPPLYCENAVSISFLAFFLQFFCPVGTSRVHHIDPPLSLTNLPLHASFAMPIGCVRKPARSSIHVLSPSAPHVCWEGQSRLSPMKVYPSEVKQSSSSLLSYCIFTFFPCGQHF